MITQVDRTKTHEVQKITKFAKGKMLLSHYQVVELPAGDAAKVKVFLTLTEARAAIGKTNGGKTVH